MKKLAPRIFIYASIMFGIIGISLVIFGGPDDNTQPNITLMKLLMTCVFIILPSFAVSVAGKYFGDK